MKTIIKKLTSRKFWAAVVGFITPLMLTFGADGKTVEQAIALTVAGATLIAYIFGEGYTDASHAKESGEDTEIVAPLCNGECPNVYFSENNNTGNGEDDGEYQNICFVGNTESDEENSMDINDGQTEDEK